MEKNKIILVGSREENSTEVKHIKAFANPIWAAKYAKSFGVYAVFSEVEIDGKFHKELPLILTKYL